MMFQKMYKQGLHTIIVLLMLWIPVCVSASDANFYQSILMEKGKANRLEGPTAILEIQEGVLKENLNISLSSIEESNLPKLDKGMTNVTDSVSGYRFLPHGEHFAGKGAKVVIRYDRTKIPSGYTEDDIHTYFFDPERQCWVPLQRDSIDRANRAIISKTTHFTDMINGVIQSPESPETQGFIPTLMSDLQAADPTSKVQLMQAPQANNDGTAVLSYSLEMPPARNGMSPDLSLRYSSDAGSGWLGEGWNLTTSTISVDTRWGVPRYDKAHESETYLLDGQMLTDEDGELPHRRLGKDRKSGEAVFYLRKEGSFSKIVRKGTSPSNYIWLVTDRKGTKYHYGAYEIKDRRNQNGVLVKDTSIIGVMKGGYQGDSTNMVISEWRLTRIEEIHGDYVNFKYAEKKEFITSTLQANALYLDSVTAGNKGNEPHTIVTFENGIEKSVRRSDARYGYITSSNRLLDKVSVYFEGKFLRGYSFTYTNGAFSANLLESISHLDSKERIFHTHKMEYHGMTSEDGNHLSFYSGEQSVESVENSPLSSLFSEITGDVVKEGFEGNYSMINSGSSKDGVSVGGGCNVGVGPVFAGANYNYNYNTSETDISLVDLNGDGLPDKVYMDGETMCYEPAIFGSNKFGKKVELRGAPSYFGHSKSSTHTLSEEVGVGFSSVSVSATFSQSWNESTTDVYFHDFNSDGLLDIAYKGNVYFNYLNANGDPCFTEFSSETANELAKMEASEIPDFKGITPNVNRDSLKTALKDSFPLHDAVRVWKAPFQGSVTIKSNIQLNDNLPIESGKEGFLDGVFYSIQHDTVLLTQMTPTAEKISVERNVNVNKGDLLFFRLNSKEQGLNDEVSIDISIKYNDVHGVPNKTEEGLSLKMYNSKADYVSGVNATVMAPSQSTLSINPNRYKKTAETLGDIFLDIKYEYVDTIATTGSKNVRRQEESIRLNTKESYDMDVANLRQIQVPADSTLIVTFNIRSEFPFDDKTISWKPFVVVTDSNGVADTIVIVPNRTMYNNFVDIQPVSILRDNKDSVNYLEPFDSLFVVRINKSETTTDDERRADKIYAEVNGSAPASAIKIRTYLYDEEGDSIITKIEDGDSLPVRLVANKQIRILSYFDAELSDSSRVNVSFVRQYVNTNNEGNAATQIVEEIQTLTSSLRSYLGERDQQLGLLYHGWGQFAYKGENERIKMEHFEIDKNKYDKDQIENWAKSTDDALIGSTISEMVGKANKANFFSMSYNAQKDVYYGASNRVYVTSTTQSSSRLGNHLIDVDDIIPTYKAPEEQDGKRGSFFSPSIIASSFTSSSTLGGGLKSGFGLSGSTSDTEVLTESSLLDLNGDGYPDWLSGDEDIVDVQYTKSNGSLTEKSETKRFRFSSPQQEASASSLGFSGKSVASAQTNGGRSTSQSIRNMRKASFEFDMNSSPRSVSASGNGSSGDSNSKNDWCDVNGDGLPDMLFKDGWARLNLGYSFTDTIKVEGLNYIDDSKTMSVGAGMGLSFPLCGSANISAGVNGSFTMNNTDFVLMDINGDGLPDKVRIEDNYDIEDILLPDMKGRYTVAFNKGLGNGFSEEVSLLSDGSVGRSKSTAFSTYANGGATFYVWYISLTPFVNGAKSYSMSRTLNSVSDFNGDGFPDLIESNEENKVKVKLSQIGATNKLKSVTNPLGGKYSIEFTHTKPTTDHPGGKWAMSQLTVSDSTNNPKMISKFNYENGKRDRREREFLGFGKVYTTYMDGNDTVRVFLQEYDVTHYLTAGNMTRSLMAGKDTTIKFREEQTAYKYFSVSNEGALDEADPAQCSRLFSVPSVKTTTAYEKGERLDLSKESYLYGSGYGNLDKYQFEDLTNDQHGYTTEITYANAMYGTPNHVMVKGSDGSTYREVNASYGDDATPWAMTKMEQSVADGKAVIDLEYDIYGNITKKTLPENSNKERMSYTYLYDRKYQMYPERVTDAFGYRSEMEDYDYRYGIPRTVRDINGYSVQYHVDDLGRIDTIISPNEQSDGVPYTIAYNYVNGTDYRSTYAMTKHYDPQHPDDPLVTITHVDGLGRPYQVKKEAEIYGQGVEYIVSGRTKYDALGRSVETTHPTTCNTTDGTKIVDFSDNLLNSATYDAIDRPLTQTLPSDESSSVGESSVTTMDYSISNGLMKTTVVAANKDVTHSYVNGAGQTVRSERFDPQTNDIVAINYFFDPIGQLDSLIDAGGNVTRYVYDMLGRKLSVSHPSTGLTTFQYDLSGNVLEKQTANLALKSSSIKYDYEYNRLKKITYPEHPENNVSYSYGGKNADHNRVGRLSLIEDGSGATEFYYGKMGEVIKQRRTLVIPNVAVATYTTQWKYDSHNRLLEMIYPDEEKVMYNYNLGGLLCSVVGEKKYLYNYVDTIGYDLYEQRTYLKYGNGVETNYGYSTNRRRLSMLDVVSPMYEGKIMSNVYKYDEMDNISSIINSAKANSIGTTGKTIGGNISHTYTYDKWSRLQAAEGIFDAGAKKARYNLTMGYDKLYNVTTKKLDLTQENLQFEGSLNTGHEFAYHYDENNPFKLLDVSAKEYATDSSKADTIHKVNLYDFDSNGNQIMAVANPTTDSVCVADTAGTQVRQLLWDEENRLLAINDNGYVSNYFYDANGERTVKITSPSLSLYVNSKGALNLDTFPTKFVAYVSPYLVVKNGGEYTKHIYIGSQRIVSKLGDFDAFGADPRRVEKAGVDIKTIDFGKKYGEAKITARYDSFGIACPIKENKDYMEGKSYCCSGGEPLTEMDNYSSQRGESARQENNIYYYHPDHLGSVSLISDAEGFISRSTSYIPYGEVFVEESATGWQSPYYFNAKELDNETGLYYYGARYLDPTGAMWLSVDPMWEKYVGATVYNYCHNSPIAYIDPNGKDEYGVSSTGEIALIKKTNDAKDQLIAGVLIDKNGNIKKGKSGDVSGLEYDKNKCLKNNHIEVKKGVFSGNSTNRKAYRGIGHRYMFDDKEEANKVFEFLACNTKVEWGFYNKRFKSTEKEQEYFYLTTSHEQYQEKLSGTMVANEIKTIIIDFHIHSHPTDFSVSGQLNAAPSDWDIKFANGVQNIDKDFLNSNPKFSIFSRGVYHDYTPHK